MQVITSKENEQIKHIRKLKEKKYRDELGEYVIEGIKLLKEAIQEKEDIQTVVVCDGCDEDGSIDAKLLYEIAKLNCILVPEKLFESLADTKTPQGTLAVIKKKEQEEKIDYKDDMIVILDHIQDPGNMGTILRTIDSCNLKQVIVSKGSVDCYSPKVIRSTMGAIFRVNVVESEDLQKTIKEIKKRKFRVLGTALEESSNIYKTDLQKTAFIIGNESQGVAKELLDLVDEKISIPMLGKTESLNASVATGVILYEAVRQKRFLKK